MTPYPHDAHRLTRMGLGTSKSGWAFDAPLGNPGRYDPKTGISLMTIANNPELAARMARRPRWSADFSRGAHR